MAVKKKAAGAKKAASTKSAKARPAPARKPLVEVALDAAPVFEPACAAEVPPVPEAEGPIEVAPVPDTSPAGDSRPAVLTKKGKTSRYLLPGNMEIAALGPVHADLVSMEASNEGPFVLDGAQLSVIDTAGLQLLISFVSAVKSSGKKVSWDNYSVQAYQLANELGVVDQLGD